MRVLTQCNVYGLWKYKFLSENTWINILIYGDRNDGPMLFKVTLFRVSMTTAIDKLRLRQRKLLAAWHKFVSAETLHATGETDLRVQRKRGSTFQQGACLLPCVCACCSLLMAALHLHLHSTDSDSEISIDFFQRRCNSIKWNVYRHVFSMFMFRYWIY